MACKKNRPVSLEEAKERLRSAASDISILDCVRENPLAALAVAATSGFVLGSSSKVREVVSEVALWLLRRNRN